MKGLCQKSSREAGESNSETECVGGDFASGHHYSSCLLAQVPTSVWILIILKNIELGFLVKMVE